MTTQVTVQGSQGQFDKSVEFTSGTTSSAVDLGGETLLGIITPASLASTSLAIYVCNTLNGTYLPLKDKTGTAITSITTSSSAEALSVGDLVQQLKGWRFIKLEAGSSETSKTIIIVSAVV